MRHRAPIPPRDASPLDPSALLAACDSVTARAEEALPIAKQNNWILDIALNRLTLARAGLYRALLAPPAGAQRPPSPPPAVEAHLTAAVDGLRKAGRMDYLPRGLLTQVLRLALFRG
ncbi:MAG: hypothetical protein BECKG1743D_GA0114223_110273 [Candidatus Kentron sp. G]|nr:MAG: hypothetical protein BECKG1743F_GA0114225_109883 [Candidatus Kentron sp. G]VFN06388.1 MAG: hypothetical protein BECKG1743E_GA0114224_110073 [Candidatus Kentron sp. G]VFN07288.1 MAG: hypothetical protein BECKG1743D_GA0114223_110273 [Candidatus Kentron sp. G]